MEHAARRHDYDFDLAVVGAGPGGAACALAAARKSLRVVAFDPRTDGDKPCGEGILPSGVAVLRELGLGDVLATGVAFDAIHYCTPGLASLAVPLGGSAVALARPLLQACFDEALRREPRIELVAQRAEVERDASGPGFTLRAGDETFTARTLAVADGNFGSTAPWLARRARPGGSRERVGLRLRARATAPLEQVEVHIGRGPEVYLTPLPEGLVNAAVLYSKLPARVHGSAALVEHALALYPQARARIGAIETPPSSRRLGAASRRVAGSSTFAVGDAGGGVDPILGCGVSIALATGLLAAKSAAEIAAGAAPSAVERRYARAYARETSQRRRLAGFLRLTSRFEWSARAVVTLGRLAPSASAALAHIALGHAASYSWR